MNTGRPQRVAYITDLVVTTDTHLAALAIEHQCTVHSNDADFRRFPSLRWHNPLDAHD
jgi:predicted nucleic acid-binding protein